MYRVIIHERRSRKKETVFSREISFLHRFRYLGDSTSIDFMQQLNGYAYPKSKSDIFIFFICISRYIWASICLFGTFLLTIAAVIVISLIPVYLLDHSSSDGTSPDAGKIILHVPLRFHAVHLLLLF